MEVCIFVVLYYGFEGLSDLPNLFGVDCVVLFMYQLVSHKLKASIDNPGVCSVMFMVFEGVMNPQFSPYSSVSSGKSIISIFLVPSHSIRKCMMSNSCLSHIRQ